ncbi:hypothetical protein FCM35_KLT05993 [Carex littledalei]|uniref:F-box domain-containing protein n=1 Tax=Carex littledalei TaxID=544730 RepID=A0A833QLZ0_9POAL|nr:hypothetical protein FCM35_KLT05993 [Carex littledalei]
MMSTMAESLLSSNFNIIFLILSLLPTETLLRVQTVCCAWAHHLLPGICLGPLLSSFSDNRIVYTKETAYWQPICQSILQTLSRGSQISRLHLRHSVERL